MLTTSSKDDQTSLRYYARVMRHALVLILLMHAESSSAQSPVPAVINSVSSPGTTVTQPQITVESSIETAKASNIKAVYLYSFARFTTWGSFGSRSQSVFTIGVVGTSGVSTSLEKIASKRTIHDRPIRVKKYASPADVSTDDCDLVFLTSSVVLTDSSDLLARLRDTSVLTVTETASRPDGTVVNFVAEGNGIIFEINLEEAKRKNLAMDARLLRQGKRMLPTQPTQGL